MPFVPSRPVVDSVAALFVAIVRVSLLMCVAARFVWADANSEVEADTSVLAPLLLSHVSHRALDMDGHHTEVAGANILCPVHSGRCVTWVGLGWGLLVVVGGWGWARLVLCALSALLGWRPHARTSVLLSCSYHFNVPEFKRGSALSAENQLAGMLRTQLCIEKVRVCARVVMRT